MVGGIGGLGMSLGGLGGVGGGAGSIGAGSGGGSVGAGPSSIVSLGATAAGPADTYGALAGTVPSAVSINIDNISSQTGLSSDFVTGFMIGHAAANQWKDTLTEALLMALLLDYLKDKK